MKVMLVLTAVLTVISLLVVAVIGVLNAILPPSVAMTIDLTTAFCIPSVILAIMIVVFTHSSYVWDAVEIYFTLSLPSLLPSLELALLAAPDRPTSDPRTLALSHFDIVVGLLPLIVMVVIGGPLGVLYVLVSYRQFKRLQTLSGSEHFPVIWKSVVSGNTRGQKLAHEKILDIGTPAIPNLLMILGSQEESSETRCKAVELLGDIADTTATAGLLEVFESESSLTVNKAIVEVLRRIGSVQSISGMIVGLRRSMPKVESLRAHIDDQLCKLEASAVPNLIALLDHPDPLVRCKTAETLGKIKAANAVPALIAHLGDVTFIPAQDAAILRPNYRKTSTQARNVELRVCDVVCATLRTIGTPEALAAIEDWRQKGPASDTLSG